MADSIDALITILNSAEFPLRTEAAEALGRTHHERALDALQEAMKPYVFMRRDADDENSFYFTTALILAEHGRYFSYRFVVDEDAPFVRGRVVTMLERIGKDRAVIAAIAMLKSQKSDERYWAAETLYALKDQRASVPLIEAQEHESYFDARRTMLLALTACGTSEALPALKKLLRSSPNEEIRRVVGLAIDAIEKRASQ